MVWYLLRSTFVLRAASARAAARAWGVRGLSSVLPRPCPARGALPLPLAGEGGVGALGSGNRSPAGSRWRANALPGDPTSPASGRGEEDALRDCVLASASTSTGSICAYSATRRV